MRTRRREGPLHLTGGLPELLSARTGRAPVFGVNLSCAILLMALPRLTFLDRVRPRGHRCSGPHNGQTLAGPRGRAHGQTAFV